jgi:hypothetical protein
MVDLQLAMSSAWKKPWAQLMIWGRSFIIIEEPYHLLTCMRLPKVVEHRQRAVCQTVLKFLWSRDLNYVVPAEFDIAF